MKSLLGGNDLRAFALGVLAGCSCLGGVPALPAAEVDTRRDSTVEAVERVLPSVVNIATATIVRRGDPFEDTWNQFWDPYHRRQAPGSVGYSLGSGVIIDEEGYVLTNDHVARRAAKIWIKPTMSTNVYEALVAAEDSRADVALLKIQAKPGEKFAAIKFGQDDDLLLGETVLALGNPFGLGGSVSRGILSSKSRMAPKETEQLDIPNWLQTDASINPGSSGGPLVNLRGELIGLSVAVLANAQGIGFAIPVKRVAEALSQMITPESSSKRLWFGARVRAGAGPLAITAVQPESPAAKAGLKAGDILAQVDGQTPKGFIHLNEMLLAGPKRERTFTVLREGERRTVTVALLPESTFFDAALIEKKLGVTLQELTPKLAREQGVEVTAGLLVARVERDTPAAESLQPGFLVTSIDDRRPANVVEAAKWIHAKKPGETVQLGVFVRQRYGYRAGTIDLPVR